MLAVPLLAPRRRHAQGLRDCVAENTVAVFDVCWHRDDVVRRRFEFFSDPAVHQLVAFTSNNGLVVASSTHTLPLFMLRLTPITFDFDLARQRASCLDALSALVSGKRTKAPAVLAKIAEDAAWLAPRALMLAMSFGRAALAEQLVAELARRQLLDWTWRDEQRIARLTIRATCCTNGALPTARADFCA
jgi:hypothetical protein